MKYVLFFIFTYLLIATAFAGPEDKWIYVGPKFDGIALLLAVAAFVWIYVMYKDLKTKKKSRR